jgi:membrane carboxypeptidase/penicillin-binding protein
VRSRGFTLPAAGKTGTSRDGWFAGYTKDLLAIAWVGYDDNRDLNLEGSRSALPIWTEFMSKAYKLYPTRDPEHAYFTVPSGIEYASIDSESFQVANPSCADTFEEVFIAGTVPPSHCPLHGFTISSAVQEGVTEVVTEVGKGATEAGKGIGRIYRGIGRVFGGIFGGGDDKKQEPAPAKP